MVAELSLTKERDPASRLPCATQIVQHSEETYTEYEGCLSIPGWVGEVPRHVELTVKARRPKARDAPQGERLLRPVLQHEIDHLDGVLFTERVVDIKTLHQLDPRRPRKKKSCWRSSSQQYCRGARPCALLLLRSNGV